MLSGVEAEILQPVAHLFLGSISDYRFQIIDQVRFGLVFGSKNVQFHIVCSLQYSVNINTVEPESHPDLLYNDLVKPKN